MGILERFRLNGRTALVTGGTKGLGKAMAMAMAEAGANVIVCSRHETDCETVAAELCASAGGEAMGICADITDAVAVEEMVRRTKERFGSIDILINSAGINIRHLIEQYPVEDFDRVVATNLKGSWLCCRAVSETMKAQGCGSVINVSSALGLVGLAERTAYCATKAAIIGLTRTLALEWAASGVRCNAICPGPFMTEINQVLLQDPAKAAQVVGQTAMKRWGELEEIQGIALFLASDASSYMTGASLAIDGGWVAG